MPNRIIKESICTSDSIDALGWFAEVVFYRLIVNCDDFGRFDGRPAIIKNRLFPLKDSLSTENVTAAIQDLVNAGLAVMYEHNGKPYLYLPTWNDHQNVRAKRSKYPAPDDSVIAHDSICKQMYADDCNGNQMQANVPVIQSNPIQSVSVSESKAASLYVAPSLPEIESFAKGRNSPVDPKRFFSHYEGTNWTDKKGNPIRDWKKQFMAWEAYERKKPTDRKFPDFDDGKADEQLDRLLRKMNGETNH